MNLTAIHLYSKPDTLITTTPLKHAELKLSEISKSDSYIIKGISGLDSDEIISTFLSSTKTDDLYNVFIPPRTVSIAIRLNPNYAAGETPSSLRDNLYKMVAYRKTAEIDLRFMNGVDHICTLTGRINKFETSLFSAEPEVQITFYCEQPMFLAPAPVVVPVSAATFAVTDNLSTAPHGFKMELTFSYAATAFTITHGPVNSSIPDFEIAMTGLVTGSILQFSSEYNNRYVRTYNPGGSPVNWMQNLSATSIWPMVYPGITNFVLDTPAMGSGLSMNSFSHTPAYWGV